VLREDAELAVVAAQLFEERDQVLWLVHHLHDVHEGPQQAAALHLHVDREQVARLGRAAEKDGVEVSAELVGTWLDECEAGPDDLDHP